jgi:hypothetical protein
MSTSLMVSLSAAFWIGSSLLAGQVILAAVFAVGHVLFWQNHVLEIKINKLLDERGIFVADYEIKK